MALIPDTGLVDPSTATTRAGRTASDFVLAERGGRRRTLRLTREARPAQGMDIERSTMESVSRMQGSMDATVQRFGPSWAPISLRGLWRTVWLSRRIATVQENGTVTPILDAAAADKVFESLWLEGQDFDLVWETVALRVTISRFKSRWIRREDLDWEATLTVIGPGLTDAKLEYSAEYNFILDSGTIFARLSGYLTTARNAINGILAYERALTSYIDRVDLLAKELAQTIEAAGNVAQAPARLSRRAESAMLSIGSQWGACVSAMNKIDAAYASDGTGVGLLRSQRARVNLIGAARAGQRDALAGALKARRSYKATIKRIFTATAETDLRLVAQQEYGDPAAWTLIADATGITTPTPDAGLSILVPNRSF